MLIATLQHIAKKYSTDVLAVEDVSLDVSDGERIALIGPSGCGKTTLLNLMAGLDVPSGGSVAVVPGTRIAVAFQEDATFPWLTVQQNVEFPLLRGGATKRSASIAARDSLELMGLGGFRHAWPRQLSGGMRKRVDLARAFAFGGDLLLLDEPFGSVDALTKLELQDLLLAADVTRSAAVLVTHDIDEAVLFADRVIVLTERPARIRSVVPVALPNHRTTALRFSPAFGVTREAVAAALGLHVTVGGAK